MTPTILHRALVLWILLVLVGCGVSGTTSSRNAEVVLQPTTVRVTPDPTTGVPKTPTPPPLRTAQVGTSAAALRNRWLHGIPCPSPCWEGITPGKTSLTEAVALLKTKPFITSMVLTPTHVYKDVDFFSWDYADDQGRGIGSYDLTAPNHTILSFSPGFPMEGPLRDIIPYYDEPSHIIATARYDGPNENASSVVNDVSYFVVFVYVTHGFFVSSDVDSSDAVLNDGMTLFSVGMFPANIPDIAYLFRRAQIQPQDVKVWQGFKPFRFYCRASDGSDACQK